MESEEKKPPVVHAVIVHHRGQEMLDLCLRSLVDSADVTLDVVVVSNHCLEPLPELVDEHPRIHTVASNRPLGFSEANNLGVRWARAHLGEPYAYYFVNNDTRSTPEAIARQCEALRSVDGAAIAGPQLRIWGAPDHLNSLGLQITEDAWGWDEGIGQRLADYGPLPERRPVLAVTGAALMMTAESFRAVDEWPEIYGFYFEDIDICVKAWKLGRPVIHVPEALVYHRISATMTEDEKGAQRKNYLFWRNRLYLAVMHWPRHLLRPLIGLVLRGIRARGWRGSAIQRRALLGALWRLPGLLRQRWRRRPHRGEWQNFLRQPGSVPAITLPYVAPEAVFGGATGSGGDASRWRDARELCPAKDGGRRVLVVGCAPLPFENARMNYAPGLRTWQFARALADDGHAVCVAAMRIPGTGGDDAEVSLTTRDGVLCYSLPRHLFESKESEESEALAELVGAFHPDVLVGASALPSRRAVELAGERPVWVDLFGDPMAEAQARSEVAGADGLTPYLDLLWPLLERGDGFSAVSDRQRHAAVGQLGLAGRLNRANHGLELVHTVPCCPAPESASTEPVDVPEDVGDDDVLVLWSGGFNTWCDVDTLFAALEQAMERRPEILFAATGGAIRGHDEGSFARFKTLVEGARRPERYLLKGALPAAEADRYLARADLGVVTEKRIYERVLGSSGRVVRWLARGLPFVCAEVSELSAEVAAAEAGLTYDPGDAAGLAARIVEAAADPELRRRLGENGRGFAAGLTFAETARPVRDWVRRGERLPDHAQPRVGDQRTASTRLAEAEKRLAETQHQLDLIHGSKMWTLWMSWIALRRALARPFRKADG